MSALRICAAPRLPKRISPITMHVSMPLRRIFITGILHESSVSSIASDFHQPSPEPVADDRGADRPPDRERDGRRGRIVGPKHSDRDGTRAVTSGPREGTKGLTAVDASDHAESLARP